MKKVFFFLAMTACVSLFTACQDDDESVAEDFEYSITFNSPNEEDKHVNDDMHIHIDFESATSQTIHHINVRIYEKDNEANEIYNEPSDAHIHEGSGKYEYHHDYPLTAANGVNEHTDWIMEAKVWGEEAGKGEVISTIGFHVHPE